MPNSLEIFGDKTTIHVLRYFLSRAKSKTYLAKLICDLHISKVSVIKALGKLSALGILNCEQLGKIKLYSLENESPLVKEFKRIISISYLISKLRIFLSSNCEVYLFGSSARGENDEQSDYDLLVISDDRVVSRRLLKTIDVEKIKPLFFTKFEYAALYRKDNPLYERIEKDKLRLI